MARQLRNMNKQLDGIMKAFGKDANRIWKKGIESKQISPSILKTNDGRRAVDHKDLDEKVQKAFNLSEEEALTGVYLIFKGSDLFYVGHSTNIARRLKRHFSKPFEKKVSREEKRNKPFTTVLEKRNMSIAIYRITDEQNYMFRKTLDRIITYTQVPEYLKQTLGNPEDERTTTRRTRTSHKRTTA
ncbi:GIY-YIG nuclease family protein [Salinicoccus sp. ID82-1]|uniref:GIY-YIG nuclease family protein n=1 Tax=Salinicoccus cyprini TaxID=2493691 RepID=A0A558AXJ5_9STAP|nr:MULTISPECIES: GIY-YIG nuclease family protein [Salinicoccus]MCG1008497.1 GIY-YIG nuclease family protein [Salinicoccus sp. ID82-1]TVT28981.1 GIY-YIG nuclease family protein [Salinicoccus cyprini]